ncbi:MAG: 2-polyprenylphenol 6-hydroxylase [bacterium]
MFTAILDMMRLAKAGFVLARYDALIPQEYAHMLPLPARIIGAISRIGARDRALRPGQRLARALGGQGPAYVKFGQLLGTRPDIIGFEMAEDLGELQDRMPPFPLAEAQREIESALKRPVTELFQELSEPVAAASVAQVHKARLPNGEEVAVKVLRPKIEKKASEELRAFMRGAKIIEFFSPAARRMEPVKFIQTLKATADIELDLRMEAGAGSQLAENLASNTQIRIPEVKWDYSSRRVLTTEWIDGIPVTDLTALDQAGVDRKALAIQIMRTFLTQALHHGFFHADMHQGNMFIDKNERLVLIDFGIMGRLDEEARRAYAQIIYGFIKRDYHLAAQAHFDAGYVPDHYSVDAFATALRAVGEPIFGRDSTSVDMSRVLQQLFDVTEIFDMHMRPELILLQRTMVVVEGVARALDPDINMWTAAEPVVASYISNIAGPQAILRNVRNNASAVIRLAEKFPDFALAAENAIQNIGPDGVKLSKETVDDLADALKRRHRKPTAERS